MGAEVVTLLSEDNLPEEVPGSGGEVGAQDKLKSGSGSSPRIGETLCTEFAPEIEVDGGKRCCEEGEEEDSRDEPAVRQRRGSGS